MVANILSTDPPLSTTLGDGVKRSKFNLSEFGHVAYQIKWNHKCSNTLANIPPPNPGGQKVKIQLFQAMVMLHIKLKGTRYAATW